MRRDFQLFLSYRLAFVSQVFSTLFAVTLFYYVSRLCRRPSSLAPTPTSPT